MARISMEALAIAIQKVRAMSMKDKEHLTDEVFAKQPNMLCSVLALSRMGVSIEKVDFLLELLLLCFQAMKESGLNWPLITEQVQEAQLERQVAVMKFDQGLKPSLKHAAREKYADSHPEHFLLAFVLNEIQDWRGRVNTEESDTHIMLSAINLVNCLAWVELPDSRKGAFGPHSNNVSRGQV